jgi:hypothetical protein
LADAARPASIMMGVVDHRTAEELAAGLDTILRSPRGTGRVELIVRRPAVGEREVVAVGELDPIVGLVGDTWNQRASKRTPDGSPHPDMQLNIMSAAAVALVAGDRDRWPLAGDQFYVDLDISEEALPPGTRLRIGSAVVEITDQPHLGCAKFTQRFGLDAMRFVNSPEGRAVRARGVNARVVTAGVVRAGDEIVVV